MSKHFQSKSGFMTYVKLVSFMMWNNLFIRSKAKQQSWKAERDAVLVLTGAGR